MVEDYRVLLSMLAYMAAEFDRMGEPDLAEWARLMEGFTRQRMAKIEGVPALCFDGNDNGEQPD